MLLQSSMTTKESEKKNSTASQLSSPNSVLHSSSLENVDDSSCNDSPNTSLDSNEIKSNSIGGAVADLSERMEKAAVSKNYSSEGGRVYPMREIRNQMFRLTATVGQVSMKFLECGESLVECNDDDSNVVNVDFDSNMDDIASCLVTQLRHILHLTDLLDMDLALIVEKKMELNRRKYPVELCKGKAGKYTEYSNHTGITKDIGQDLITTNGEENRTGSLRTKYTAFVSILPSLTERIRQFAIDRDWQQYHTPRNILLAMTGELGELIELVQFKGDDVHGMLQTKEIDKLGQETADVTIYLLRLADVCNIDLYQLMK